MKLNMATGHELSVIINSCVKNPVDPHSGLISTIDKREGPSRSATWQGRIHELDKENHVNKSLDFDRKQVVGPDLNNLSDAEFYERLVSLKDEHKKTLQLCESLYNHKLTELRSSSPLSQHRSNGLTTVSVSRDFNMSPEPQTGQPRRSFDTKDSANKTRKSTGDRIKDMNSTKPPSGRPQTADGMSRSRSFERKSAWMTATGSPYGSREEDLFKAGVEDQYEQFRSTSRSPVAREFAHANESHGTGMNDSRMSAMSKFSDMWENFSVDDYAPRTKPRPRSASLSRMTSSRPKSASEATSKEWRHKITIPKPFNMTLREGEKTPMKTKAMVELDVKRELQLRQSEAECTKKFKAKPVPAHVYMPLYDEIMEEKETKRRYNKQACSEVLKSQEKPFKFMTREAEKKKERIVKTGSLAEYDGKSKTNFKANPFPTHIFKDTVTDKIKEEEEYRQLRVQMRAEELLKTASLPPNMASRGQEYVDGKSRQKLYVERAKKAGITPEHKFRPAVNDDMPDFDELHRQYMKEIAQRKARREATVCKPFNLRSERIDRKKHEHDSQSDYRWPQTSSHARPALSLTKTLSTSMDAIPAKLTTAAQLRMSANKEKLQRQIQSELTELETMRKKRLKEEKLKKSINEKAMANDMTSERTRERERKLREHRESGKARQEEYNSQLNEMFERVNNRPMLFERTAQENARKAADKKYVETLQKAGLDEDFVNKKGMAATSSGTVDKYFSSGNVSDDDSYSQNRSHHSLSRHTTSVSKTAGYSDDYEQESRGSRTQSEVELEEDLA